MQTKLSGGKSQMSIVGCSLVVTPLEPFLSSGFYLPSLLSSEMAICNLGSSNADTNTMPLLPG